MSWSPRPRSAHEHRSRSRQERAADGMMAGIEIKHDGVGGRRGTQLQKDMFWNGMHVKFTGDNAILAPAFVAEKSHIDEIVDKFRKTLDQHL